jgi:hypothetical protein
MPDIIVGTSISISTVIPETNGVATRVVENVARSKKTVNLSQSFLNHSGHLRKKPENLLLYCLVLPFRGLKNDPRWIRSPKKGRGQIVHQNRPKNGVIIAISANNQIAHIKRTPRFLPETLVPKTHVRITI